MAWSFSIADVGGSGFWTARLFCDGCGWVWIARAGWFDWVVSCRLFAWAFYVIGMDGFWTSLFSSLSRIGFLALVFPLIGSVGSRVVSSAVAGRVEWIGLRELAALHCCIGELLGARFVSLAFWPAVLPCANWVMG